MTPDSAVRLAEIFAKFPALILFTDGPLRGKVTTLSPDVWGINGFTQIVVPACNCDEPACPQTWDDTTYVPVLDEYGVRSRNDAGWFAYREEVSSG